MVSKISAIHLSDVHRISSGQVIVDLTSAVKELVENSLDANSNKIDITFKNYGLDFIECSDNGDGIHEDNFEELALKHYTSKIENFEDVSKILSLGFRGEALSSLCAVAKIVAITTINGPKAFKLEYDFHGKLIKKTMTSRSKGTTIQVSQIFDNLPVRRKEFTRNCKRHFQQCVVVLQGYALINESCKISVWHITPNGKKSLVLSSTQNQGISKNLLSILGPNSLKGLNEISLILDLNDFKSKITNKYHESSLHTIDYKIKVSGYISNNSSGCGRPSKDRQYIYINKRPVDHPHLSKCFNEVYRHFNNLQYPMIILNFQVPPELIDINVTPDKRTVLLHNEEYVIDMLNNKLMAYYEAQDLLLPQASISIEKLQSKKRKLDSPCNSVSESLKEHDSNINLPRNVEGDNGVLQNKKCLSSIESYNENSNSNKQENIIQVYDNFDTEKDNTELDTMAHNIENSNVPLNIQNHSTDYKKNLSNLSQIENDSATKNSTERIETKENRTQRRFEDPDNTTDHMHQNNVQKKLQNMSYSNLYPSKFKNRGIDPESLPTVNSCENPEINLSSATLTQPANSKISQFLESIRCHTYISMDDIIEISKRMRMFVHGTKTNKRYFKTNNTLEDAENEEKSLTLSVSKTDFQHMEVIGQFNLGFILVTRRQNNKFDLFIIDQHASDEKYNFEMLQKNTVLKAQALLAPLTVELSAVDELTVLDNLEIFQKNGFKLEVNEEQPQGFKIKLITLPVSKQTLFGVTDFHELICLLKESNGSNKSNIRCSKIRSMLAMRACRSSIMVGKSLNRKMMTRIVRNLGDLDKPWNCPHGRPTMRHLMELKDWDSFNEDYQL